jgi:sulfur relay (sulfurtransferase) complex TusBCD TusD component (DsrE family)
MSLDAKVRVVLCKSCSEYRDVVVDRKRSVRFSRSLGP